MRGPSITLLTDFGTADGYVAEMKGVLTSLAPDSAIIDASHEVLPQDVQGARLALARYWRHFPVGTVHVVVVDPGVGTHAPRSRWRATVGISSAPTTAYSPQRSSGRARAW